MADALKKRPALRGFLIDIDGVLRHINEPIPGAAETLRALRRRRIPFRLLTNTTSKSRAQLSRELGDIGFEVPSEEIYTASAVAAAYLKGQGAQRCWVLLRGTALDEFRDLELTDQQPEYIVLGDMGDDFDAGLMNRAYRALLAGARLIAIQHNPSWTAVDGPRLDVGAWSAALEYATGQPAVVAGKPSATAFRLPAAELGIPIETVGMVGDDPDADIAGARDAGLQAIFVHTTAMPDRRPVSSEEYDYAIDSLADLPDLLAR